MSRYYSAGVYRGVPKQTEFVSSLRSMHLCQWEPTWHEAQWKVVVSTPFFSYWLSHEVYLLDTAMCIGHTFNCYLVAQEEVNFVTWTHQVECIE